MKQLEPTEIWFITGSQHLYGEAVLKRIAENSRKMVTGMRRSKRLPLPLVLNPVLTTPEQIR